MGAGQYKMVRSYHQLNGHEFDKIPGHNEEQGTWHAAAH